MKDVIRELMYEVGLDLINNTIIDQDTNVALKFDNKLLKYSYDKHININKEKEMFFNPLTNLKLAISLFTHYLSKLERIEQIYFPTFFTIKGNDKKHAVVVKNHKISIQSNYYYNLTLAYISMIFKINDKDRDLSFLDYNMKE